MIRIALVDDDDQYLTQMQEFLQRYSKEHDTAFTVSTFHDGLNFVEDYDAAQDIIFMDIEMPLLDGMEAARRIRAKDERVAIIFITNMAQYAIRGYEVNAIDFILKPLDYYAFADRLTRALRIAALNAPKTIVLQTTDGELIRVPISELLYVEKSGNYCIYHVRTEAASYRQLPQHRNDSTDQNVNHGRHGTEGEPAPTKDTAYTMRGTLSEIEDELIKEGFSYCSKGILVNLRFVGKASKDTVLVGGETLPLSRRRYKEFMADLMRYLGGTFQ